MSTTLVRGGTLVTDAGRRECDVYVDGGVIAEIGRDTTIGTLDAPAGEYPCGINVDGDGNFTFVGWADGEKYSTKISLVEQPMVVPHLLQVLTPAGEKGSILRLVFGNVHGSSVRPSS